MESAGPREMNRPPPRALCAVAPHLLQDLLVGYPPKKRTLRTSWLLQRWVAATTQMNAQAESVQRPQPASLRLRAEV
eukprot:scaffold74749_cov63-Phaeocystis_antarctica.AAC.1